MLGQEVVPDVRELVAAAVPVQGRVLHTDVDSLFNTPLEPLGFPIQNGDVIQVHCVSRTLYADMFGNL